MIHIELYPDNFVMGASGCSNNWAKGRFTEGTRIVYS